MHTGNNGGACSPQSCFATTPAGVWAAADAHRYGFTYEPWHVRYLGPDVAQKLFDAGISLEEHASFPAAPGY